MTIAPEPARRSRRRFGVFLMATVLVVSGCRAQSATDESSASSTTPTPTTSAPRTGEMTPATQATRATQQPDRFTPEPVAWRSCAPAGFQCGNVEVPLDYDDPEGEKISLSVKRRPADDREARIGSLFFNPGGPGASGVESLADVVKVFSDGVRERFDIVSWDPRGVGDSAPVECDGGIFELYKKDLDEVDPPPEVERVAQDAAEQCQANSGELLPHVGTISTARDLDTLRQAVGDDNLTYYGASYGTLIGLVYAEMFPRSIRAMIIDGVVDPTLDPFDANLEQSIAVDRVIEEFIQWCAGRSSCPIKSDPAAALDELQRQAEEGRLSGTINGKTITLSPTLTALAVVTATYDDASWPTLATAVSRALDGDGNALARIANVYLSQASLGANNAVNCIDSPKPTKDQIDELAERAAREAPRAGVFNANTGRVCEHWAAPAEPIDHTLDVDGAPPIMVWGTTGDNATPYKNAVHVAELVPDARLATLEANRHAALGANSCVEQIQTAYLVDLEVPAEGTRC